MMTKSLMQNLCFSPGTLDDLEGIMVIEQASFSYPWTEAMVLSELFDNPFAESFVVRLDGEEKIVAYVFARRVVDELHLMDLAVDPVWRRRGIGEQLIRRVLSSGAEKGLEKVILEVRVSNLPAQRLYRKLGFYQVGERRNYYYKPTENAFLFQLDRHKKEGGSDHFLKPGLEQKGQSKPVSWVS